jgi:LVIVD repeat
MRRWALVAATGVALALATAGTVRGDVVVGPGGGTPGTSLNFTLVGHNPLFDRGMNAAPAIFDHFVYVGNRSDGSNSCGDSDPGPGVVPVLTPTNPDGTCTHVHPGILVVDVANPAIPTVVGEFGTAFVTGPNEGQTARELRVLPAQKLLMVMYFRCSRVIHACPQTAQRFSIRFFDLGANPVNPPLVATYTPTLLPHEMYLWIDPKDSNRALLWLSTPTTSVNPSTPNLIITDISRARQGVFAEIARGNWNQFFPGAADPANYDFDLALHSMTPSVDGKRTYLAYLRGGFGILDTSKVANNEVPAGTVESLNDDLLTPAPFPTWGTGPQCPGHTAASCAESHSAVPFPGRPFALTIDEVYGTFTVPSFGWPWGWARTWNVARPSRPHILGEYKILQNTETFRPFVDPATEQFTSYSSHNPTLTRNVALDAWHSGGLQAIDIEDPGHPTQAGWFSPTPLDSVALEDPALSRGPNKVVMWSFPIVRDGLVYVVDIRNGLYVLDYNGPRAAEIDGLTFLEGNSNLGDALEIDQSAGG